MFRRLRDLGRDTAVVAASEVQSPREPSPQASWVACDFETTGLLVERLQPPVPLELLEFGLAGTLRRLGSVRLRDVPRSPEGGVIADYTGEFGDPAALAARLAATVGVVEHGLFSPALVSEVVIARGEQVEIRAVN